MKARTGSARSDRASVIVADLSLCGDRGYRLGLEIASLADRGHRVGLVQAAGRETDAQSATEIEICLRHAEADLVSAGEVAHARAIVHEPSRLDAAVLASALRDVPETDVVCYSETDAGTARSLKAGRKTELRLWRTGEHVCPAEGEVFSGFWLPVVRAAGRLPSSRTTRTVGWYSGSIPAGLTEGDGHIALGNSRSVPADLQHHVRPTRLTMRRLLAGVDVLAIPQELPCDDLPDALVASFLNSRRTVVAPVWLRSHYGAGLVYYTDNTLQAQIKKAIARAGKASRAREFPGFLARCQDAPLSQVASSARQPKLRRTEASTSKTERPALFVPSNGVGIGHLTRLLAVARRMSAPAIFASQAAAVDVIRQFGFQASYLPSAAQVGGDFSHWDKWFQVELERLLALYNPDLVVYDGNHPSPGLIEAVGSSHDCLLAWIRRGMWARTTSSHLGNARWFDVIIEPGELAARLDNGVTSRLRGETVAVEPIRLLDDAELLPRPVAAAALGLDPDRPAALIQLGSGYNRDLLSLIDQIVEILSSTPGLQIAVAEWVTGSIPLSLWANVQILRGFPLSRYLRAFDFCISAAGYNSYHELIGFGVPSIFIANKHPAMDDQAARARFAQDSAAAFEIGEDDLEDLPNLVAMLMQPPARAYLTANCRAMDNGNGAAAAARNLSSLRELARSLAS